MENTESGLEPFGRCPQCKGQADYFLISMNVCVFPPQEFARDSATVECWSCGYRKTVPLVVEGGIALFVSEGDSIILRVLPCKPYAKAIQHVRHKISGVKSASAKTLKRKRAGKKT